MKTIQALVTSCSIVVVTGALQKEAVVYSVESFPTRNSEKPVTSWLRNLLPPAKTSPDEADIVTHQLYEVASFQSVLDRRFGGGLLGRFKGSNTRGGSSVVDDEDGHSSVPILSQTSQSHPYSVRTTLLYGKGETLLSAGCEIIEAKQTTRLIALWDDNTPALWKTCAFLSDTLIVGLTERSTVSPLLTQALQAGLVARKAQKLSKPRLVFALHSDPNDKTELKEWKEDLVVNELSGISERLVDTFEVTPVQDVLAKKPKSRKGGVSKIADPDTFPRLLDQVHTSFGGPDDTLLEAYIDEVSEPAQLLPTPKPAPLEQETISRTTRPPQEVRPDPTLVLETAMAQLELLQDQQDDAALEAQKGSMPFDFASYAAPILDLIGSSMKELSFDEQAVVQQQIGVHIQQLYQQQLSALRDYYGRLYETMLDNSDSEKEWKKSASKVHEQFRKAAASAVPANIKPFGELDLQYLSSCAANGLHDDMMQAMELRQTIEFQSDSEDSAVVNEKRKTLPTWYKKLAARGLVLGINYFQGWLAWQGIKRAALQRERNLPKFPLF
jgi:hypothetical protein